MRTVNFPSGMTDEDREAFFKKVAMTGGRNTYEALEKIDRLLKPHGLELVLYDGFSDYIFEIAPLNDVQAEKNKDV